MSLNKLKEVVFNIANGLCEYCKSPANISTQSFVIEHIKPKSKNGETIPENLALSCQGCNNYKYNKTSGIDTITNEEVKLFHPREQEWNLNFAWSDDGIEIVGLSANGRVTIDALKLNRTELKNLRMLLAQVGKHPPK